MSSKAKDLILFKRMKKHIFNLDTRWKESYQMKFIVNNEVFAILENFTTRAWRDKHHINHFKIFVKRSSKLKLIDAKWQDLTKFNEINEEWRED